MQTFGSDAFPDEGRLDRNTSKHVTSRRVATTFEAWNPSLGMMVTMNSGAPLRVIQIVFDKHLGGRRSPIKRAVEFESGGIRYYAAFDTLQENSSPEALSDDSGTDAR